MPDQMKETINQMAINTFGMTIETAKAERICIRCQKPVGGRIYSVLGAEEYSISGLCELCFDEITLPK